MLHHSFAALETGSDMRTVQELLGHTGVKMTMIYTHVMNQPRIHVRSPADTFRKLVLRDFFPDYMMRHSPSSWPLSAPSIAGLISAPRGRVCGAGPSTMKVGAVELTGLPRAIY